MNRDRLGSVWLGLTFIGLGVMLLLGQWLGWGQLWPLFPLIGGLSFLVAYVLGGFRDAGLVFVGTAAVLVGLFFLGFTTGHWEWAEMERLWPVFPLIGGVAFCALFVAERARDLGTLTVGAVALVIGIAGLGITFGFLGKEVVKLWPLLLILIGLFGLASGVIRLLRRG